MVTGNLDWQWPSAGSGSAGGQNCAIFGRSNPGYGRLGRENLHNFWKEWEVGAWKPKLRNSWRELTVTCWDLGSKNCAIRQGNQQSAVGSLTVKTAQYLEGTGNELLGATSQKNWVEACLLITSVQFLSWANCWATESLLMQSAQFSRWAFSRPTSGLAGKTAQFSEKDRDGHWVSIRPICLIFSVSRVGKIYNLYTIFLGNQSQGDYRVKLSGQPPRRLIDQLAGSVIWNDFLGASMLFWVTVNWVDGGVKVWLLEGDLVVINSAKWLSVWASEKAYTWTYKHTLTELDDEMTQTMQTNMFNITDWQCERQVQCLWLIVEWPRRCLCNIVYDSVCERDECLHSEHNMYTRSEDLVYEQNMVASMTLTSTCKSCLSNEQARWVRRLTRDHWMNPSACIH